MRALPVKSEASLTIESRHEEETRRLGEGCGRLIRSAVVLSLIGDLGSGKTVFVQGLARGLEVPERYYVTSPSFTIIHQYPGRLALFHIDLYRLDSDLDPDELGLTEILKGDGVAAVEWADKLPLPFRSDRLEVRFEIGEGDCRTLRLFAYGQDAWSLLNRLTSIVDGHRSTPEQH